jgi:hypothetical protein
MHYLSAPLWVHGWTPNCANRLNEWMNGSSLPQKRWWSVFGILLSFWICGMGRCNFHVKRFAFSVCN